MLKERGEECAALQTQINHQVGYFYYIRSWSSKLTLERVLKSITRGIILYYIFKQNINYKK